MRFAAIADVHGNCLALEAVLADIKRQGVEVVVNLGDHLSGPLEARRTAELLMRLDLPTVRGNCDRSMVETNPADLSLSDQAACAQLEQWHRGWLAAMPATLVFRDDVLLCHGTPCSDTTYWLERVNPDGFVRMAWHSEIEAATAGFNYPLMLCGHTHIPRALRLKDGRMVVNPGSVGLPGYDHNDPVDHVMETGSPDASYAILEKDAGRWSATFRQVAYENLAMADLARRGGRLEWARALATGWAR